MTNEEFNALPLVAVGGIVTKSKNVRLFMRKGFDRVHSDLMDSYAKRASRSEPGFYGFGDEDNPFCSWPIYAQVSING